MTTTVIITCNGCGDSVEIPFESLFTAEQMTSIFHPPGWTSPDKDTQFCPDCSERESELVLAEKYSKSKLAVAKYRLWVITPLLKIENGNERKQAVIRRAEEVRELLEDGDAPIQKTGYSEFLSVSAASIYRWLNAYSEMWELESLIPLTHKRGCRRSYRLESEPERIMQTIVEEYVLNQEDKYTLDYMWNELALQIESYNQGADPIKWVVVPSRATLARRIKSFKQKLLLKKGELLHQSQIPLPETNQETE